MTARSTEDIYWLAGFLEGEGCFHLRSNRLGQKRYPSVTFTTTDKDVAGHALEILGLGTCKTRPDKRKPQYKDIYRVDVSNTGHAIAWMMTLYSLMGERRREKIREIISLWKERPPMRTSPSSPYAPPSRRT